MTSFDLLTILVGVGAAGGFVGWFAWEAGRRFGNAEGRIEGWHGGYHFAQARRLHPAREDAVVLRFAPRPRVYDWSKDDAG